MNETLTHREIRIAAAAVRLPGDLVVPDEAEGLVVFAHGSGSSRFSSRNRQVGSALNARGLATCLFDLLTPNEETRDRETREYRFNIPLLAGRVIHAVDALRQHEDCAHLRIGLFGASTGAAAALIAAAERRDDVRAVVSRGGRPDLAGDALAKVSAPTLLIVGERDAEVIDLNRRAATQLSCEHRVVIVPGASHLFEEPGALDAVERLAGDWFAGRLQRGSGQ